jgi:hypothetical protein
MRMIDVVLQATGSMEAWLVFCQDNNVGITDIPVPGTVYQVSDAALAAGDADALKKIRRDVVTFGLLGAYEPAMVLSEDGTPALSEDGNYQYSED